MHTVGMFTRGRDGAIAANNIYDSLPEGTMGGAGSWQPSWATGGPVGVAVGAAGGMLIGATADYAKARVTADFAQHVAAELKPGRTAVVAEVYKKASPGTSAGTRRHDLSARSCRTSRTRNTNTRSQRSRPISLRSKPNGPRKRADRKARLRAKTDPLIKKVEQKLARDRS